MRLGDAGWTAVQQAIIAQANADGVPPALALAVADVESGFNQQIPPGSAGDTGVFQLIPATAASLGVDPANLQQNIQGGVEYLSAQLGTFGDPRLALWAYNAGPARVQAYLDNGTPVPASTQKYANLVLAKAAQYQAQLAAASGAGAAPAAAGPTVPAGWILAAVLGLGAILVFTG